MLLLFYYLSIEILKSDFITFVDYIVLPSTSERKKDLY